MSNVTDSQITYFSVINVRMPRGRVKQHRNRQSDCASNVLVHNSDFHHKFADPRAMDCRPHCGACCIAPSISSPIPGMPDGKPAGTACVQLDVNMRCRIFGQSERPVCCAGLQPSQEMCGGSRHEAIAWLTRLEEMTSPSRVPSHETVQCGLPDRI